MADRKISEMTGASALAGADILPVVQGGANKKVTVANIFGKINTQVHINEGQTDTDTIISGDSDTHLIFVDAGLDRVGVGTNMPAEKLDVNGGIKLNGVVRNSSVETISSGTVASLTVDTTIINIASNITNLVLGDGFEGQERTFVLRTSNSSTAVINPTNKYGFNTITLQQDGAVAVLKFISGSWYLLSTRLSAV